MYKIHHIILKKKVSVHFIFTLHSFFNHRFSLVGTSSLLKYRRKVGIFHLRTILNVKPSNADNRSWRKHALNHIAPIEMKLKKNIPSKKIIKAKIRTYFIRIDLRLIQLKRINSILIVYVICFRLEFSVD